jgi:carboxypeptidase C (cathepsin A)
VDLILTIIRPEREQQAPMVSQRRLWNDTICDCRSIMHWTQALEVKKVNFFVKK